MYIRVEVHEMKTVRSGGKPFFDNLEKLVKEYLIPAMKLAISNWVSARHWMRCS
jgi:hypothetical protein